MSPQTFESEAAAAADLPRERTQFKELLLAKHFADGSAPEADGPPTGNTTYEQLVCIGYQPQLAQLNAVVQLKQGNGYSGGICTNGSQEYVEFFASTDDGAAWTTLGMTSFTAWDVAGPKPLDFDVTLPVDLAATCCKYENIVLIRAILSWEVPPGGPTDPIVWGNGLDAHVQVAPLALGTFENLVECLELPIELDTLAEVVNLDQVIEFAPLNELSPADLHKLYRGTKVPQHRYLLSQVTKLLDDPAALSAAANDADFTLVPGLKGIDLGGLIDLISDPQGNETYEQLGCIGLNTTTSRLVATIEVKLPNGYSGGLCTNGSQEYVAFWADWGSGYEYVGTTAVNVHDIESIPTGGLEYAVAMTFEQALTQRQPCGDGPQIVPVRAVLSWATPPSNSNPYAVPVWGGHLEANVLIPPGQPTSAAGGPDLESIGSMALSDIDQGTGLATGVSLVGFPASQCPFGASVTFTGHVINASGGLGGTGLQYRILVSPNGGATYTPMTEPFTVTTDDWATNTQHTVPQTPDANGWVTCRENYAASVDVVGNVLGSWQTSGDGQLWIAMEVRQGTTPLGPPTPAWTMIQLDNTAPSPVAVAITSGSGSCGDFFPGSTIDGNYSASDNENLASVAIAVEMPMAAAPQKTPPITKTLTFESGNWQLVTPPSAQPCGYTIVVTATDNTIIDSGYIGWQTQVFTGFCLRPQP